MEALKAELAKKRKATTDELNSRPAKKYMRRGDVERLKQMEAEQTKHSPEPRQEQVLFPF